MGKIIIMDIERFLSKLVFFILIFFSVIIISSNLIGFFWLNSSFIFLFSIVSSFILFKKFYFDSFLIPKKVFVLALLLVILLSYPVLLITNFFPASADATTTTAVRILTEKIPLTYEPFANVSFAYQIGFPLLVNVFSDLIPQIPDYIWGWLLSLVSGVLQLFAVYLFSKEFFKNENTAFFTAVLFLGTKLVFENLYVGEYAWLLATVFLLFTLYFLLKKNNLALLVFPPIFILHPAIGLNAIVILFVFLIFFKEKFNLLALAWSLLVAVPAFLFNYLPILKNLLFSSEGFSGSLGAFDYVYYLGLLPLWLGLIPFLVFILGLVFFTLKKISFTKEQKVFMGVFVSGFILYYFFAFLNFVLVGRVVEIMLLASLFLGASLLEKISSNYSFNQKILIVILLILSVGIFFNSGVLNHYRNGSKISMDEASFAYEFNKFDSSFSKALILSPGYGKIAEFSNKIPYDVYSAHTITTQKFLYSDPSEFERLNERNALRESILDGSCLECISGIDVDYIVVNKTFFNQKLNYPVVFSYGNFVVYNK